MTRRHLLLGAMGTIPLAALRAQTQASQSRTCVINASLKRMGYGVAVSAMPGGMLQCELEGTHVVVPAFALREGNFPRIGRGQKCFLLETELGTYYALGVPSGSRVSTYRATVLSVQSDTCQLSYKDTAGTLHSQTASIAADGVGVFAPPNPGQEYLVVTLESGPVNYM